MPNTNTLPRPPIHSTFGEDTLRVRLTDADTSHEAADRNDIAASRAFVMFVAFSEDRPLTDWELERLGAGIYSPSRLRTARKELTTAEFGGLLTMLNTRGPSATRELGAMQWEVSK